jgi:hypothetical protein
MSNKHRRVQRRLQERRRDRPAQLLPRRDAIQAMLDSRTPTEETTDDDE